MFEGMAWYDEVSMIQNGAIQRADSGTVQLPQHQAVQGADVYGLAAVRDGQRGEGTWLLIS